jgi:hypothetical protein
MLDLLALCTCLHMGSVGFMYMSAHGILYQVLIHMGWFRLLVFRSFFVLFIIEFSGPLSADRVTNLP